MLQRLLIVLATGLIFSPTSSIAKDLFRYETEAGTLSFTDHPDQVPARYRASVEKISMPRLAKYDRLTVVSSRARYAPASGGELAAPVEHPRAPVRSPARAPGSFHYGLGGQMALELPLASDEPVHVRQMQWRKVERQGLSYWKPFTVIEQGGRTLAEIESN